MARPKAQGRAKRRKYLSMGFKACRHLAGRKLSAERRAFSKCAGQAASLIAGRSSRTSSGRCFTFESNSTRRRASDRLGRLFLRASNADLIRKPMAIMRTISRQGSPMRSQMPENAPMRKTLNIAPAKAKIGA